jgi:cell division protein ZapA (FtsZ GTPase activity inhibitor)
MIPESVTEIAADIDELLRQLMKCKTSFQQTQAHAISAAINTNHSTTSGNHDCISDLLGGGNVIEETS